MAKILSRGKMGKPEELYDMVHTENLVLVDTKKESSRFL
jgi:protein SCO1/2